MRESRGSRSARVGAPTALIHRSAWKGEFCEVQLPLYGVLGSTYSPGPTPISAPSCDRRSSVLIPTLGSFSARFSELVGALPEAYRRRAARVTAGMPSCVAKRATRPIRNREVRLHNRE